MVTFESISLFSLTIPMPHDLYNQLVEDHADIFNRLYKPEVPTIEN
jgi:hypothetical protein